MRLVLACALMLVVAAAPPDGGVSFAPPEVTALSLVTDAGAAPLDLDAGTPAEPFAANYLPPVETEAGAGAGQLRLFAIGGVTFTPDVMGEFTAESMHLSFLALRGVLTAELTNLGAAHPHLMTARLGVALHVAPYHRLDASLFLDAGGVLANAFTPNLEAAPLVAPGVAFEAALTSHLFFRVEGQLLWAVLPATGNLTRWAALLGLGWTM